MFLFSFEDIVLLRAANELLKNAIPHRQIHRSLRRLRERLPKGQPLSSVRIVADGGSVLVQEKASAWNPVSGQFSLSFSVEEVADKVAPLVRQSAESAHDSNDLTSDDWYELALELEMIAALEDAKVAYAMAIESGPENADAKVNLGRLFQLSGETARAEALYRDALKTDPEHATAAFNLGTALEERGATEEAIRTYRRALSIAPALADAHFNLAQLYEESGDRLAAMRHLRKYKGLTLERG